MKHKFNYLFKKAISLFHTKKNTNVEPTEEITVPQPYYYKPYVTKSDFKKAAEIKEEDFEKFFYIKNMYGLFSLYNGWITTNSMNSKDEFVKLNLTALKK